MNRIEAQTIEAIVHEPHERVFDEEFSDKRPLVSFEVYRRSPAGRVAVCKERLSVAMKIIKLWPKVIINDIEINHDVLIMGRAEQALQVLGPAILGIRCI